MHSEVPLLNKNNITAEESALLHQNNVETTNAPSSSSPPGETQQAPSQQLSKKVFALTLLLLGICAGLSWSLTKTLGQIYVILQDDYNATATQASAINAFFYGSFYFCGPLAHVVLNQTGYILMICFGIILIVVGLVLSTLHPPLGWLYITFGILPGIGNSVIQHSVHTFVGKVFDQRRPLANNILKAAPPLMMMPLLFQVLVDNYDFTQALYVIAFYIAFVGLLFVSYLKCLIMNFYPAAIKQRIDNVKETSTWGVPGKEAFVFYLLYGGFATSAKILISLYIFRLANELGVDSIVITYAFVAEAALMIFLRVATGFIYIRNTLGHCLVNRLVILMVCIGTRAVACLVMALCAKSQVSLFITYIFYAVISGCVGGLPVTVMTDLYGQETLSSSIGLQMFVNGLFAITTSPLLGFVIDQYQSSYDAPYLYRIPTYVATACYFVCLILLIPVWMYQQRRKHIPDEEEIGKDDEVQENDEV